jgi:hypothetical protein
MPKPGFSINGTPEWMPRVSLQSQAARDAILHAPRGPERDLLIDKWLNSQLLDLSISMKGYRAFLAKRTKPNWAFWKHDSEDAAYWRLRLSTVNEVEVWWKWRFESMAEEFRNSDVHFP